MRKSSINLIATAAVVAVAALSSPSAFAQDAKLPTPVIAIIDGDMIANESLAGKGVVLEQSKYAEVLKGFITDNETKLRAEEQDLTRQRATLAPDVFEQKARAFQQKAADLQMQVKQRSDQISFATQMAQRELTGNILQIGQEIAKQRGANVALNKAQVIMFEPAFEISKQVLAALNQKVTTIKFIDPNTLQIVYNEQGQIIDVKQNGQPVGGAPGAAPAPAAKAPAKK
jgi:outer membrane protein